MKRSSIIKDETLAKLRAYDIPKGYQDTVFGIFILSDLIGYEYDNMAGFLAHIDQRFSDEGLIISYNIKREGTIAYINLSLPFDIRPSVYSRYYVREREDSFEILYSMYPVEHLK